MWSVNVDVDGAVHKFETLAEQANDLEKPLGAFGGYLRRRAIERYKAQAFAPLAESTVEKRASKGLHSLEGKLQSDVRRALGRARKIREAAAPRGLLQRIVRMKTDRALDDALGLQTRGVQNRLAVLAEFHGNRQHMKFKDRVEAKPVTIKQAIGLAQREARAVMRAVNQPILGGLPRTLAVIVSGDSVTLRSQTHEKWSKAHNEGATVGKGSKLPQRETLKLESTDLDVFVAILKHYLLLPVASGLHGPAF